MGSPAETAFRLITKKGRLDLVLVGARAVRQPALRRPVLLFAPAAALSVVLHLRAAQKVEIIP